MSLWPKVLATWVATLAAGTAAGRSAAREGDGAYGRLDGDITLGVGAGVGVESAQQRVFSTTEVRARYLDAAGAVVFYE
ncbi:MAG: hypothetical protein NVS3B20_26290 [Polyangiales bacterium]